MVNILTGTELSKRVYAVVSEVRAGKLADRRINRLWLSMVGGWSVEIDKAEQLGLIVKDVEGYYRLAAKPLRLTYRGRTKQNKRVWTGSYDLVLQATQYCQSKLIPAKARRNGNNGNWLLVIKEWRKHV